MNQIDTMRQALAALQVFLDIDTLHGNKRAIVNSASAALRTAIAQAERCEPVCELRADMKGGAYLHWLSSATFEPGTKLYTHPPMLTDAAVEQPAQQDYWQEEARRYAENADFWRGKYEAAIAQPMLTPAAVERAALGIANAERESNHLTPAKQLSDLSGAEHYKAQARAALAAAWEAK